MTGPPCPARWADGWPGTADWHALPRGDGAPWRCERSATRLHTARTVKEGQRTDLACDRQGYVRGPSVFHGPNAAWQHGPGAGGQGGTSGEGLTGLVVLLARLLLLDFALVAPTGVTPPMASRVTFRRCG